MENNKVVTITSAVILVALIGAILRLAKPVFFPFFLAILFYFILSPALDFLTRLKIPRGLALLFIIIVAFLVFYLLGILIYTSGKGFANSLPQYGDKLNEYLQWIREKLRLTEQDWDPWAWSKTINPQKLASWALASLDRVFSFFSTFALIFVFLVFMLAGRGRLRVKVDKSFSPARAEKVNRVIDNIDSQVQKYLIIKTAVSLVSGIITTAVLAIFGVDYAIILGFLAFILNYIPSLGSIVALILCVLAAAVQLSSLWPALWIFLILLVLDVLVGNVLEPKMMGHGLGLSPLLVLLSLIFWGWLWGIPGMILAVPIMAVIKIICSNIPALHPIAELMSG